MTRAATSQRAEQAAPRIETPIVGQRPRLLTLIILYGILGLGAICAIFPIYFLAQATQYPGTELYSTELHILPTSVTLENFEWVFSESRLRHWLINSFIIASATTFLTLLIALPAGYALSRFRFGGRRVFIGTILILQAFPSMLSLFAYYLILNQLRLTNTHTGLIFIYSSASILFNILNVKSYFDTIPADLEDAATMDGATPGETFALVMVPMARPVIVVTAILGFLVGWNEYIIAQTLLYEETLYTAPIGIYSLVGDNFILPWGHFAAASLLVSLPVLITFIYLQRHLLGEINPAATMR